MAINFIKKNIKKIKYLFLIKIYLKIHKINFSQELNYQFNKIYLLVLMY